MMKFEFFRCCSVVVYIVLYYVVFFAIAVVMKILLCNLLILYDMCVCAVVKKQLQLYVFIC